MAVALFTCCCFMSCNQNNPEESKNPYPYLRLSDLAALHRVPLKNAEAKLAEMSYTGGWQKYYDVRNQAYEEAYLYTSKEKQDTIILVPSTNGEIKMVNYIATKGILPADAKSWLTHIPEKASMQNWKDILDFMGGSVYNYATKQEAGGNYSEYCKAVENITSGTMAQATWHSESSTGYCYINLMYEYSNNTDFAMLVISSEVNDEPIDPDPEDPSKTMFKITVSNIEATTADLSVVPADENVWYGLGIYTAADVAKYTADSIVAYEVAEIAGYVAQGYGLDVLAEYGYAFKGKLETPLSELPANTELTVIVYRLIEQAGTVVLGDVAYKTFKTKELTASGSETLTLAGVYDDEVAEEGWYQIMAYSEDEKYYLSLSPDPVTSLTQDIKFSDLDLEWSYLYVDETKYSLADAAYKVTMNGETMTATGKIVASNGIEYLFTAVCEPYVEANEAAPAKVRAAKKAAKAVSAFNKHIMLKK